jgi:hypothetical protein
VCKNIRLFDKNKNKKVFKFVKKKLRSKERIEMVLQMSTKVGIMSRLKKFKK